MQHILQSSRGAWNGSNFDRSPWSKSHLLSHQDLDQESLFADFLINQGPGAGHEYLAPLADLWELYGIPTLIYDQIGCGRSTHFREKIYDNEFWVGVFVRNVESGRLGQYIGIVRGEASARSLLAASRFS